MMRANKQRSLKVPKPPKRPGDPRDKKVTRTKNAGGIDWGITIVPICIILVLSVLLMFFPEVASNLLTSLKNVFTNQLGFFYILIGLGVLLLAIWLSFSKYGKIKLGNLQKPRYKNFAWGSMIFTSTMAADILYWSLIEWAYYYTDAPFGMENMTKVQLQEWSSTYPLFHWGPIPWAFYILPAVAYGYMFFVKKRHRQTLSEACRPTIKKHADGILGKVIDIFSVVGLLAGTATTFSLATPLLTQAVARIFGIQPTKFISIIMLLLVAAVFTAAVLCGMKAISLVAKLCVIVFVVLVGIFVICGPKVYMIESGISAIGNMVQNFFHMSTWMDPAREAGSFGFPQNWTIFYWSYWIAWFVATPFFIGKISEGRTIRQTVLGGLSCGLAGTFTSFVVFGNYGLFQQITGRLNIADSLAGGMTPAEVIIRIFDTLPITNIALIVLIIAMIAFYASTFDAITLVVAGYSHKKLAKDEEPHKGLRIFWALIFIILPVALIFSESTLQNLQTIAIIAAFPLGLIMILIIYSFFKDMKKDYKAAIMAGKIPANDSIVLDDIAPEGSTSQETASAETKTSVSADGM